MPRFIFFRLPHFLFLCAAVGSLISCKADDAPTGDAMLIKPPTKTYVIASPLEGQLLKGGKPLTNWKLERKLEWNGDKEGVETQAFQTDDSGFFSLPVFEVETTMRGLEQFVGKSKIYAATESGEMELIWYSPTMTEHVYSDTGSPVEDLVCDLSNAEVVTQDTPNKILTRCRWKNMLDFIEV